MQYKNPVIRGFNPDPSVCRKGADYYLVTSTFEYFPGIPVYHSTDLVNWEHIGNCIDRPGQLPMETAEYSGGIWAPTIRYNGGRFYVTATFSGKGNFIISSDDPSGSWSDPVWSEMDGIDPSMYFEGGVMYYCANDCGSRESDTEGISLAIVDVNSGKLMSGIKRIWEGTGGGFLEAPHIYRIGDWYYLLAAEGGTNYNHMTTAARSRSIWGPYEACSNNPILTNRNDTSKQVLCSGHADLVEDTKGNIWLIHLGTRPSAGNMSHLGRETFLTPAVFSDGQIRALPDGKARIEADAELCAPQLPMKRAEFDFNNEEWERQWLFLRKPCMENYERGGGCLILRPSAVKITDKKLSPTFAAVRQPDLECTAEISFRFDTEETGDEAGAVIYLTPEFMYRVFKRREDDGDYLVFKKLAGDFEQTVYHEKIEDGQIDLKIDAGACCYRFSCSVNGRAERIGSASTRFLCCELADKCFTGVLIGIYAQAEKNTGAAAEFNGFKLVCGKNI